MQFSIKAMLSLTALVAAAIAVLFIVPEEVASVVLVIAAFALPALLTIGVVYARGNARAFCIGALFPAGAGLLFVVLPGEYRYEFYYAHLIMDLFHFSKGTYAPQVEHLRDMANGMRHVAGATWLLAIIVGLACMWLRWMLGDASKSTDAR